MSTEFNILTENTFGFKGGKLYVMLLRDNGSYGVEVVDRAKTFGRKMADSREQAEFLFKSICDRLSNYKTIEDAVDAITKAFTFESVDKVLFVIIMDDKVCSQDDIVSIRDVIKFRTLLKFGYKKKVKEEDALTIYIYEKRTDKKPYAILVGTTKGSDFKLELI
jgi:Glu-tRNA(Gln) amidotransferase subunit E-like FAD-binding protein